MSEQEAFNIFRFAVGVAHLNAYSSDEDEEIQARNEEEEALEPGSEEAVPAQPAR